MDDRRMNSLAAILLTLCSFFSSSMAFSVELENHFVIGTDDAIDQNFSSAIEELLKQHYEQTELPVKLVISRENLSAQSLLQDIDGKDSLAGEKGVIVLYNPDKKSIELASGFGLDAYLPPSRLEDIEKNTFSERVDHSDLKDALTFTVLSILESLESPVVEMGTYKNILETHGIRTLKTDNQKTGFFFNFLILLISVTLCAVAGFVLTGPEFEYSAKGGARIHPSTQVKLEVLSLKKTAPNHDLEAQYGIW